MGNVDVYLDNVFQANVNLNVTGARQAQQVVYSKTGPGQRPAHDQDRQQDHLGRHGRRAADPHRRHHRRPAARLRAQANSLYVSAASRRRADRRRRHASAPAEQFEPSTSAAATSPCGPGSTTSSSAPENAGANPLIANRASAGSWETFTLVRNSDGTVSLRATVNNKYVVAENGGAAALIANRDAIGPWEKFDLVAL